jgi:ABC-2 type transport system ATP-binding protein
VAEIITTEGLRKRFGDVVALKGLDLAVEAGSVFGLLGPNGAGKTTGVRILTTLLEPDGGRAQVAGYDVVKDAAALRAVLGLAGQFAAVDENLTGFENLEMVGRLYHLPKAEARRRAAEVLERFGLTEAGDRPAKTYSGGMRRRLDLGGSLVARPRVLFLDEPTTGLDPRSRLDLWAMIRELRSEGTTLLLTTQYLEEADHLADRIAVIDLGTVIAEGTVDQLKDRMGGEVLELHVSDTGQTQRAADVLTGIGTGTHVVDPEVGLVRIHAGTDGTSVVFEAVRRLDDAQIWVADLALHKPTLDDVFLSLTGHTAEQAAEEAEAAAPTRGRRRKERV